MNGLLPDTRLAARERILDEANKVRTKLSGGGQKPYTMRHINRAVRTCRHYRLVDDDVLRAAGFNLQKQP